MPRGREQFEIGKIQRVELRQVWPHEALDFTTWLEENTDTLSDVLGISVENVEREKAAGAFSVDLVGEDSHGSPVIIENQLERSDHDHLGKLITYLAALEAKAAIWIVKDPRPEHVGAVTWLNESSGANFYLIKVEAIRIGESPAAPLLTLITGPSDETREVAAKKQERSERHNVREAFWATLLERAAPQTRLHSNVSPGTETWLSTGAGKAGVHWNYRLRQRSVGVQLALESPDQARNMQIMSELIAHRLDIEEVFGGPLEWDSEENRKRSRITKTLEIGGYRDDQEKWPEIQDAMIDAMVRLEHALGPHLAQLGSAPSLVVTWGLVVFSPQLRAD